MTGGDRGGQGAGVDFFVSHAGRDQAWAEWVAWHLVEAGYTVELDCWDWAAGENFLTRMHRALDAANRVMALFSSAYFEDQRYTTEEWTSSLVKNDEGEHRLVPVQVEPCSVPRLLRPLLRVELFGELVGEAPGMPGRSPRSIPTLLPPLNSLYTRQGPSSASRGHPAEPPEIREFGVCVLRPSPHR